MKKNVDTTTEATATNCTSHRHRRMALTAALATTLAAGTAVVGFGASSASAIVDGEATTTTANPWQVSLQADGEHFCGGSLVSPRVVITAAHCTEGTDASDMTVRAGATDLASNDGQTRNVTKVIENQKYTTGVGDIAMLVLDKPFDASSSISIIEPATAAETAAATTARVTGWGTTGENSDESPSVLQTTDVPMVSDANCSLIEDGNDDEICAGGTGTDSCYGDSGGPLTIDTDRGRVLAGVVSWGEECGGATAGVYAEVSTYADWISDRVADPDADAGERLPAGSAEFDDSEFDDSEFDDSADETSSSDVDFESMSDDEFQNYIDSLSDADFDALLDEWDEDVVDTEDDLEADDSSEDENAENEGDFNDGDFNDGDFDTNNDGVVQWSELEQLFG